MSGSVITPTLVPNFYVEVEVRNGIQNKKTCQPGLKAEHLIKGRSNVSDFVIEPAFSSRMKYLMHL